MKPIAKLLCLIALPAISFAAPGETLEIDGYRENLLSSPSGARVGVLDRGAELHTIEQRGDWIKVRVEGWLWRDATRPQSDSTAPGGNTGNRLSAREILLPRLLKKDYSKEGLHEIVWFDIAFDTANLPARTRAIKGDLVITDLFDEVIMRIRWTINKPLSPGDEYVEKGTNFAYNEFLSHHQWVRFTEQKDMKVAFEVRNIIFDDGSHRSYFR